MRRPTRTRRLSIATSVSVMVFVMVAGAGVRSFWVADEWQDGNGRSVALFDGRATFEHALNPPFDSKGYRSFKLNLIGANRSIIGQAIWGFSLGTFYSLETRTDPPGVDTTFVVALPIGPLLLLLLIAPVRWLIARRENAPAFPVITKQA